MPSRLLLFVLSTLLFLSSCGFPEPKCSSSPNLTIDQNQLALDLVAIDSYLSDKGIEAQIDEASELRYQILNEGTGARAGNCSSISFKYVGQLMSDESTFDSSKTAITYPLPNLIPAFQIGVPKIKTGGKIMLYIPSGYGYGPAGAGSVVPSNANLIFEVELVGVN